MTPPRTAPEVTVVVPARNAAMTIGQTLAALAVQRVEGTYEVIVVDSGSSDGTPAIVASSGLAGRLLHNPGGEPAGSRNLGARHGHGGILAFTDADCAPAPDWLAAGLRALGAGHAEIVQGKVTPAEAVGPFDRSLSVNGEYGLYETANLFVTREAFDRVGGFEPAFALDPAVGSPFGEDAWFVWRAKRRGARSTFAADAVVHHAVFRRTPRDYVAERLRTRYFPPLVALIPELRTHFLHRRWFLSRRSLRFDLALAGLLAAATDRRRLPALVALPYALELARDAATFPRRSRMMPVATRVAADLATLGSLLIGSLRARTLVL